MSDGLIYLQGDPESLKPIIMQIMAFHQYMQAKDVGTIYEAPENLSDRMNGKPEIQLVFREDSDFKKGANQSGYHGQNRRKGFMSFRIINEDSNSISKAELTRIGTKIKEVYAANNGYVWEKGKELHCYADWTKGYHLKLLCRSQTEAKKLITDLLSIQNHTPDWKNLFKNENADPTERYPETPSTKIIAGDTVTPPRLRPLCEVRFQYAVAHIKGRDRPITLYDRRSKRVGALVI